MIDKKAEDRKGERKTGRGQRNDCVLIDMVFIHSTLELK